MFLFLLSLKQKRLQMKKTFHLTLIIIFYVFNFAAAQVNTEKFRVDSDSIGFSGNVNISGTVITGNTDFQLLSVNTRLNYNFGKDYIFFVGDAGYGWEDKKAFSNQALAHLRYVLAANDFLQLEFFTQLDYNKKRLLLSRELAGAGVRLKLLTTSNFKIRYGLAYMFEHEKYDLPENSIHAKITNINRLSSYVTFSELIKNGFTFISDTYFQPKIDEWKNYKLISDNSFVTELSALFDMSFGINLRYDSRPPDTIKKLDTVTKFGLTFKF